MPLRAALILCFLGLVWGGSFVFIRIAVEDASPLQVVFFRTFLGAAVLLAMARATHRPLELNATNFAGAGLLALPAILLPFLLITWAGQEIESGAAAVLNSTMPLFALLFAISFLPDERLTLTRALGVLLGLAGVTVLVGGSGAAELGSTNLAAQGAIVLASANYGLAAVAARPLIRRWNAISLSTVMISITAVYSGAIYLASERPSLNLQLDTWLAILTLGAVATGAAYIAYYILIDMVSSVRASFVAYIIPVAGVVLGAIILGESITWHTLIGGAIILLGVALGTGLLRWRAMRRSVVHQPSGAGN